MDMLGLQNDPHEIMINRAFEWPKLGQNRGSQFGSRRKSQTKSLVGSMLHARLKLGSNQFGISGQISDLGQTGSFNQKILFFYNQPQNHLSGLGLQ
jgi:hypothetical protein